VMDASFRWYLTRTYYRRNPHLPLFVNCAIRWEYPWLYPHFNGTLRCTNFASLDRVLMSDSGSRELVPWPRALVLLALAIAVAAGRAGALVLGTSVATPKTTLGARSARFAALVQSLDLDADQQARADALFAEARRTADANPDIDARRLEYRALMRQAMTTLRVSLNADQRAVLDGARAREAAGEASRDRAEKARLDQFVESLALSPEQQAIAAPLLGQAADAAKAADFDKADVLEAGYRRAFRALASTLTADQKAKLEAARKTRAAQVPR
jgi:hypothetical protein